MNSIAVIGATGSLGLVVSRLCAVSSQTVSLLLVDEDEEQLRILQKDFEHRSIEIRTGADLTLKELYACDIIHWCAPLSVVVRYQIQNSRSKTLSIFHDSAMSSSQRAIDRLSLSNACAVHMLMNEPKTVVIDTHSPHVTEIESHLKALSLSPVKLSVDEHDSLMAKSQSMIALLCSEYLEELTEYSEKKLLTPSGEELLHALKHRESRWTKSTLDSLLGNPMLEKTLTQLVNKLKST